MYRCDILLCAERVIRDADRNFVSIINLNEALAAVGFPVFIPSWDILAVVEHEPGAPLQGEAIIRMTQGEHRIFQGRAPFNQAPGKRVNRIIMHVSGLVVPGPGDLELSVSIGDKVLRAVHIRVEPPPPRTESAQEGDKPGMTAAESRKPPGL